MENRSGTPHKSQVFCTCILSLPIQLVFLIRVHALLKEARFVSRYGISIEIDNVSHHFPVANIIWSHLLIIVSTVNYRPSKELFTQL